MGHFLLRASLVRGWLGLRDVPGGESRATEGDFAGDRTDDSKR